MAAITYWVDPVSGNNANDGLSFGNAFENHTGFVDAIQAAGNGNDYTINLVNTGTHAHTATMGANQIDGQTTSTFLLRGTDSSGNPALAKIEADTDVNLVTEPYMYIRENAGITVEYIDWEYIGADSFSTMAFIYTRDNNPNPATAEFRYCRFKRGELGRTATGAIAVVAYGVSSRMGLYIHDCYFEGCSNALHSSVPNDDLVNTAFRFENNVIIDRAVSSALTRFYNVSFAVTFPITVRNNTLWEVNDQNNTSALPAMLNESVFSGVRDDLTIRDNVVWFDQPLATTSFTTGGFCLGSATGTSTLGPASSVGNNMYYLGVVGGLQDVSGYDTYDGSGPWAPDNGTLYTGDQRFENVADTALFNDVNSTYDWTPDGSAVALTIAKDLRIKRETTAGTGGTLPGALPAANTTYTLSIGASTTAPDEGQDVTLTITVEAAADATGVVNVTIPVGLTVTNDVPSAGSFAAGVWTVPLTATTPETLVLTADPDAGTGGTALQVDVDVDATSAPGADAPTSDSVTLNVVPKTDGSITVQATPDLVSVGEGVTYRVGLSNNGDDATGVEVTVALPASVSLVSANPSAGTYDPVAGLWELASVLDGAAETLDLSVLVEPGSEGATLTTTATITAITPEDSDGANDSDSASVSVVQPSLEESPGQVPFIDALPLKRPVLDLSFNTRLRTVRNRSQELYVRSDTENQLWSEHRSQRLVVDASTTTAVGLSGVQIGEFLFVESDSPVEVSFDGTSFLPASEAVILGGGNYTALSIRNPSPTDPASVLVLVVD
jgi:uncharacterized repeat protein (TIGR01451 family)